jgi:hypothetical protein
VTLPSRRTAGAASGVPTISPFQPNHTPPVCFSASITPTARPPALGRVSSPAATRFDTTINLLMRLPSSIR